MRVGFPVLVPVRRVAVMRFARSRGASMGDDDQFVGLRCATCGENAIKKRFKAESIGEDQVGLLESGHVARCRFVGVWINRARNQLRNLDVGSPDSLHHVRDERRGGHDAKRRAVRVGCEHESGKQQPDIFLILIHNSQ